MSLTSDDLETEEGVCVLIEVNNKFIGVGVHRHPELMNHKLCINNCLASCLARMRTFFKFCADQSARSISKKSIRDFSLGAVEHTVARRLA